MGIAWNVIKMVGVVGSAMVVSNVASQKAGQIAVEIVEDINTKNQLKSVVEVESIPDGTVE